MVSLILPKKQTKKFDLRYDSSKVEFFRSFYGRIQVNINRFRDLLTFSNLYLPADMVTKDRGFDAT